MAPLRTCLALLLLLGLARCQSTPYPDEEEAAFSERVPASWLRPLFPVDEEYEDALPDQPFDEGLALRSPPVTDLSSSSDIAQEATVTAPLSPARIQEKTIPPSGGGEETTSLPSSGAQEAATKPTGSALEEPTQPLDGAQEETIPPSGGGEEATTSPSGDAQEAATQPSGDAQEMISSRSSGAQEATTEPSGGALGETTPPSGGGEEATTKSSDGAREEPNQPSGGALEEPIQPSGGVLEEPAQPSGGAQEEPAQPSGGALEEPIQLSGGALEEPAQPSGGAPEEPTQLSGGVLEEPTQPSGGSREEPTQPSGGALEESIQPSGGAPEEPAQPSGGAREEPAQPSGSTLEKTNPPSGDGEEEPTQTSGGAQKEPNQASGGALEEPTQPSGGAQLAAIPPSGGTQKETTLPSGDAQEATTPPSGGDQEKTPLPSGGTQETTTPPSGGDQEKIPLPSGGSQETTTPPSGAGGEEETATRAVPASWQPELPPAEALEEEEEEEGLEGRQPPSGSQEAMLWVTPSRLATMPAELVDSDTELADYGNFELATGVKGEFASPGFPGVYPNYVWNTWKFSASDSDVALQLSCDVMELGSGDFLMVRPEGEERRSFHDHEQTIEVTAVGSMLVEFRSDGQEEGRLHCSVRASGAEDGSAEGLKPEDSRADLPKVDLNHPSCGKTKFHTRIVGGSEAPPHSFPWLVAVQTRKSKRQFCGGTIINERFVLTAAHCVYGRRPRGLAIAVAKHKRKNDLTEKIFTVKNITIHPDYNRETQDTDLAMVELQQSLRSMIADEKGWVRPICLPTKTCRSELNCYAYRTGLLAGWGLLNSTFFAGASSVQYVTVPILSNDNCQQDYAKDRIGITSRMMCAGFPEGGKDSCQGDSGGPMAVVSFDDTYTLSGVVSFGKGCGLAGYPGVYTRVSEFSDWIRDNSQL